MGKINYSFFLINTRFFYVVPVLLLNLCACSKKFFANRFSDTKLQKLFTHQYNRQTDSLYPYFLHSNPLYRKEAVLSFSSIGDTTSIERLYPLLKDTDAEVRKAAAFSIGQYKNSKALDELINQNKIEKESQVNQFLLEAIGRCANTSALEYLVSYTPKDTIDKAGLAWGVYRASRRNIFSEAGTLKLANYLSNKEVHEVSLATAFYFYQSKAFIDPYLKEILELANNSKFVEVRIAATRALRKTKKNEAVDFLFKTLLGAKDYRLRVDAINTLRSFPYDYCKTKILDALHNDINVNVKIAAAEYFEASKNVNDFNLYLNEANKTDNWRIRTLMLNAAMKTDVDKDKISDILKSYYKKAADIGEKQILLGALSHSNSNLDFILDAFKKESYGEILSTFLETLLGMKANKDFEEEAGKKIASFFVDLLASKNKYLVIQGLTGIMTPEFQVKKYFSDANFLEIAKQKAQPVFIKNDISYKLFDLALEYYASKNIEANKLFVKKAFDLTGYSTLNFKPINWKFISAIPENAKVLVKTTRGDFIIQLLVNETPFTVNAFLDGVNQKLFNDLQFYRVVPNFVNQTGGTTDLRKDSLANLRIRSEYNITRHRVGTVNLASLGRDTETSHFSIMLCPTPWNDNAYTVFGKVVQGMEVVHKIELSDYIISVNRIK
jgi:cyclophilin family peptidyl-prolyl cis-trans isomerase/HEAT repeat protein